MTTKIAVGGGAAAVVLGAWLRWGTGPVVGAFRAGVLVGRIQRSEVAR